MNSKPSFYRCLRFMSWTTRLLQFAVQAMISWEINMQKAISEAFKCFWIFWKILGGSKLFQIFIFSWLMMFLTSLWLILIGCSIPLAWFLPKKGRQLENPFQSWLWDHLRNTDPWIWSVHPQQIFHNIGISNNTLQLRWLCKASSGDIWDIYSAAQNTYPALHYQGSLAFWILSISVIGSGLEFGGLEKSTRENGAFMICFRFFIPQEWYMAL